MAVVRKPFRKMESGSVQEVKLHDPAVMKRIAETAYYLWEKRGRPHGSDMQDWAEAEKIVLGKK
jgi:hypothetical protein